MAVTETTAQARFPDAQKAASFGAGPVGSTKLMPTLPHQTSPPAHAAETGTHSPTARQGRLAASPSPDPLDVFSKPQPFDNTHTMRLDVTFQTGACPTWVRPLHVVFVFVLEKAPDAFWSQLFPLAALARPFPARVIQEGLHSAGPRHVRPARDR